MLGLRIIEVYLLVLHRVLAVVGRHGLVHLLLGGATRRSQEHL